MFSKDLDDDKIPTLKCELGNGDDIFIRYQQTFHKDFFAENPKVESKWHQITVAQNLIWHLKF